MARGDVEGVLERYIEPHLDEFVSFAFEEIARQHLWHLVVTKQLPYSIDRVGGWWSKDREVDLVAIGTEDLVLGECKWSAQAMDSDVYAELKRAGEVLLAEHPELRLGTRGRNRRLHYALFARAGFSAELRRSAQREDILLVTPRNLL